MILAENVGKSHNDKKDDSFPYRKTGRKGVKYNKSMINLFALGNFRQGYAGFA